MLKHPLLRILDIAVLLLVILLVVVVTRDDDWLRNRAQQPDSELKALQRGLYRFAAQYGRLPAMSASQTINDASLLYDDRARYLTSPVAYIKTIPRDPHAQNSDGQMSPYRYYSDAYTWGLLVGNGPDRDVDIDYDYASDRMPFMPEWYAPLTFDPSNGATSSGDIVKIVQVK